MKIEDVLARRSDLSTFLVHLTREKDGVPAKDRLKSIIRECMLKAETPMGHAVIPLQKGAVSTDCQRCVSFTETPLEHISLLIGQIEGRSFSFEPYGIAITKRQGRNDGVNPVWYVDITPNRHWLSNYINVLIEKAIQGANFDDTEIAKLAPFIEQMGSGNGFRKEFWWEREWRINGDLGLPPRIIIICPEDEVEEIESVMGEREADFKYNFIDPSWSLEQIIGRLAGFKKDKLGPM